ncbi:protein TIFY 6B-like isoform X2 [Vicia villosa]|uniref:protein TIFY 6B-like isoform X2 n=1 Tax=Vicia villosa TaxID=3911 RepID=UPI00273CCEEA|nr:protein TIFY 6B-like isoform X2 [Vicia villosa]
MERDFLSLCSNQEINNEASKDSGLRKVSAVKWPYFNKVSAHPYSMPFNVSEEDKKSFKHDGQDGVHFSVNPYPVHHDVNRAHDMKMFSVSNQAISVPAGHLFLKNHFATVGQNMNGANVKQPIRAGSPLTAPHSGLPRVGAVAGLVECVKPSAPAPQLTMFYAGTVNIFKDITPEQVHAIMLLAGNGVSAASNMAQSEVQAPSSKFASDDHGVPMSPPVNIPPISAISSPLSVSSHTGPQSGSGSVCSDEFLTAKASRGPTPTTSASKVETPKVVNATTMFSSAIPQARKASLARFLEKRKERVMSAAPYNINKKSEDAPSLNSMAANISATTGTSTLLLKQG